MSMRKEKVLVGISGGVDSAVAAALLLQQGYDVEGATFRLWDGAMAPGGKDLADAQAVCAALDIPHHVLDFRADFSRIVLDYFAAEYAAGRTPNPCVRCNKFIKWPLFLEHARRLGADKIASGHYGSVVCDGGLYRIKKGPNPKKDQSYVLYNMNQALLAHVLMPIGDMEKADTRRIAAELNLPVHAKPDSQDICFVPDGDYVAVLERLGGGCPQGNFVDAAGSAIAPHKGIWHYTIGQRRGLGLALPEPLYVCGIDAQTGDVTLAANEQLLSCALVASQINFITPIAPQDLAAPMQMSARIRYGAAPAPCVVEMQSDDTARVVFEQPQRAITPGQSVVFYDGDYLAGGGIIEAAM